MTAAATPLSDVTGHHARVSPLCVAVVTETYPPEVNGVAMTLRWLVEGLRGAGYRLHLILPRRAERTACDLDGVVVTNVPALPLPGYPALRFGLPANRALRRAWRERRPDVVYVATQGPLGMSVARLARRLGIPIVSGFHTNFHRYSAYYHVAWLSAAIVCYLRYFHRNTVFTLVPTDEAARELEGLGIANARVLGRGVDTKLFHPAKRCDALRRSWGADDKDPVLLYVSRLASEKNLDLAIAAARTVREHFSTARMVFVGDGPEEARLRANCPDFIFCGLQQGEALAAHYASADIFIFPSLSETFGNVVLEAMASGLPVVSYDIAAAHRHLRNGENGVSVPPENAAAFVLGALALAASPEVRKRLGENARAHAEALCWSRIVADFADLLAAAVHANARIGAEAR
jgi:glycosyltransferase involved in cell wall biosynthesis